MRTNEPDGLQGIAMDDREIAAVLRDNGHGVLSLASANEAYGIPISFGYDGASSVYFVFVPFGTRSEKLAYAERTERASLLVYTVESKFRWTSVIVAGPLEEVSEGDWDELVDALEDNAWFPSLFSQAEPKEDLVGWKLTIEDAGGRRGEETDPT